MKASARALRRQFPVAVALLALFIAGMATGSFRALEDSAYSLGMELSASRRASERFAVLMLDEPSRKAFGEWPWSGPQMAELLAALQRAGVRGVAWDLPPAAPATPEVQQALETLAGQLDPEGDGAATLANLSARIMPNTALASAFGDAGNVLLAIPAADRADNATATALTRARLDHVSRRRAPLDIPSDLLPPRAPFLDLLDDWLPEARPAPFRPAAVLPGLMQSARSVGPRPQLDDYSHYPLLVTVNEQWLPTLPMRMAMLALQPGSDQPWVLQGQGVALGGHWISTDREGRALPYFYPVEGPAALARHSLGDVLAGALPEDALQGRVVIVSTADAPAVVTPRHAGLLRGVALAQVAASIYSGDVYAMPWWSMVAHWLAWLAVAGWLLFAVARLDWRWAALGSVVIGLALVNVELLLLISQSWWLPLAGPVLGLAVGHVVLQLQRWRLDAAEMQRAELSAANLELGRERRSHGHLDTAFEALRRCLPGDDVLEQLRDLAHDYERRQHFAKALKVFRHIKRIAPQAPEVDQRINHLQSLEAQSLRHRNQPIDIEPGETRDPRSAPMIGRFSVLEEIARGSMAVVYRGVDSRIGRDVAVKTLALQNEFSGEDLEEVQARFFREAEAAGRLSHPNIVTIYDVGEEDGLAYIAMDLLHGPALSAHAKPDKLLPIKQVLDLGARVAEALHSAHEQNVIHRDVKPANIVMTTDESAVKVTDFGVAHLADASQTKTGTILGSPSFMSPEQVSGQRLDGRSDLWSLGVSLYQLLTGHLPFTGEPLGTLMYRIANDEPTPATDWRPDLPDCVVSILEKVLRKDPADRYQTGRGMARTLRQCAGKIGKGA